MITQVATDSRTHFGSVHDEINSWEPLKKKLFAESIVAHTGQHGLDTPMTGPAPYIKHKKNRIGSVEMIQLTNNSSTICLYSECSSPASLHSIIKQAWLASQWIMPLIFWLPNHLKKRAPSLSDSSLIVISLNSLSVSLPPFEDSTSLRSSSTTTPLTRLG